MAFGRHVIKIRKNGLRKAKWGSIESSRAQKREKNIKNFFALNGHFGVLRLNFEIRVNHTIFESSFGTLWVKFRLFP